MTNVLARRLAAGMALAVLLVGCGELPADEAASVPRGGGAAADRGDLKVRYAATSDPDFQELEAIFKDTRLLEDTVAELNNAFALPADVPVTLRECGEVNAFYDPEAQEISLCYELVSHFAELFLAEAETEEEAEEGGMAVAGATMFTFFHELGHALIHVYELPITGREEDAVDQLATLILLEGGEEGENAALDGAFSFVTEEESEISELPFWDEHSLSEQRFYNILCWAYGKDPEAFQDLVEDEWLPVERAERCPAEYEQMSRSWDTLLSPHVKE